MTQIICRVTGCVFWEQGICSAEEIEYELDDGCLTYQDLTDLEVDDEEEEDEEDDDLDWPRSRSARHADDEDEEEEWDDWDDDDEDIDL